MEFHKLIIIIALFGFCIGGVIAILHEVYKSKMNEFEEDSKRLAQVRKDHAEGKSYKYGCTEPPPEDSAS